MEQEGLKDLIDAENLVIAALVISPEKLPIVSLAPEDFHLDNNKIIYSEILKMASIDSKWDYHLLSMRLPAIVRDHLNFLTSFEIIPVLITQYVRELKNLQTTYLVKNLILKKESIEPIEFARQIHKEYDRINNETIIPTFKEIIINSYNKLSSVADLGKGALTGITSGLKAIDNYLWGFKKQSLYILAARPSVGKSALSYNIAVNAAKAGNHVYIQSLEGTGHQITCRMIAKESGINIGKIFNATMSSEEWSKYQKTSDELSRLAISIDDTPSLTSAEINKRVSLCHAHKPIDFLIIDHLQEVADKSQSRHLAISEALSSFKKLAHDLDIPILILCQLSRVVEQGADKHPMLSHLKESGDIEAKADVVMLMYREGYYSHSDADNQPVEVAVAKSRDGRTGVLTINWQPSYMRFTDN